MFDLCEAVRHLIGPIKVIDVGAMIHLDPLNVPYGSLLKKDMVEVVGFEPSDEERARLTASDKTGKRRYLPHVIGDGTPGTFRICNNNLTSSLYEPSQRVLERFDKIADLTQVVERIPVETHRLDDIVEVRGADFIKLDVQGAELDIIRGAPEILRDALIVETEVEFVPLYENQPLFGEIDQAMRAAGYWFHRFSLLETCTLRPLALKVFDPFRGQLVTGDAVYTKGFFDLAGLGVERLLKLAVLMEENYRSRDFALLALQVAEELGGPKLWDDFCKSVVGVVKERPRLP